MNTGNRVWKSIQGLLKREPVKTTSSGTFEFQEFTEADQPLYDSLKLKNPLNTFRYPSYWVVDRDHDAVLVSFGGQGSRDPEDGHPPNFYSLVWQGKGIEFQCYYKSRFLDPTKEVVSYLISRFDIPREFSKQVPFLQILLQQALFALEKRRQYPAIAIEVEFVDPYFS